jgi:hypothetical protein
MNDWIKRFRSYVSWGDQLAVATLPDGSSCCFTHLEDGLHFWVPGQLGDLPTALARANDAAQFTGCRGVTVLFLDSDATAAQVEQSIHETAAASAGCGFLEPKPAVIHGGLLELMSEGTILNGPEGM